uniref:Solute carrier organic anion transporter family member n=1 Tax=Sinocyclocheilus rhinocerous TaxID=307959 RepID=A0A673IW37_9TELE
MSVEKKTAREPCCSKLKMFLAAMCFVYFAKAFQGSYMKSSITQIERRFDIPSSLIGFIDGSFEIGNLFVIAFVSYFGAKLHRPRLIGAGCLIMAMGSFITAAPHFFQGLYKYETTISYFSASNGTESILPCLTSGSLAQDEIPTVEIQAVMLLAGIPFWFLPKSLPKQGETETVKKSNVVEGEQEHFIPDNNKHSNAPNTPAPVSMAALAKDFLPSLKKLFSNTIYIILIITTIIQVNGFIGLMTFQPKYMEQTYGHSASRAIFLIGVSNLPALALGIVTGGFIMKKFKLNILGASKFCITASLLTFSALLVQYFLQCDNSQVAGLTVSYQGAPEVSYQQNTLISQCNMACSCSLKHWDPICAASNGLTYASPCLAGCQTSTGVGKEMVFHNCTCIGDSPFPYANMSAVLGQCPRKSDCDYMFKFYMAVTIIGSFFPACAATPGYIILLRSINPELKSLALGVHILLIRTLGGIPPAIYFGALIDRTCLKWGTKQCGGRGACRIYDSIAFRLVNLQCGGVSFYKMYYGLLESKLFIL